jgi:predicted small lipoprotein YifL
LSHRRLGIPCAIAVALVVPLALAACGRKGPLDPPPSAELPPAPPPAAAPAAAQRTYLDPLTPIGTAQEARPAVAAQALPAPTQPAARSFILDPLIR